MLDILPSRMIAFPNAKPMEVGPHTVLPPVGSEQQVLGTTVPTMTVVQLPSMLAPYLWGREIPVRNTLILNVDYWSQ